MSHKRSRRDEPDRYDTPIRRPSYPLIHKMITEGVLRPIQRPAREQDDPIKGVRAVTTYAVTPGTEIQAIDAHHIVLGSTAVQADLYKMPSHTYTALVHGSPAFQELPDVDAVFATARSSDSSLQQMRELLEQVAHRPTRIDSVPQLVLPSQQFSAIWLPDNTLVKETHSGDFFVTLEFKVRFQSLFQVQAREPIAIDVGLRPLTTVLHQSGLDKSFYTTPLVLPDYQGITPQARRLHNRIVYTSGRRDCERVVAYLVQNASVVIAEQLRLDDMDRSYVEKSRARAIQDHHHAALTQYLNAARIPLNRQFAGYTSIECPKCRHVEGANRQGRIFKCRKCKYSADSHIVACQNLLHRWQRTQRRVA